ncbi:hypothetical protein A4G26_27565 [Mycobacterium kansasii]|nr:hypothetical protein A4G26_27565 [Mycobacterium kansasii]
MEPRVSKAPCSPVQRWWAAPQGLYSRQARNHLASKPDAGTVFTIAIGDKDARRTVGPLATTISCFPHISTDAHDESAAARIAASRPREPIQLTEAAAPLE